MSWIAIIALQVLASAAIATVLVWSFFHGAQQVAVIRTGWLGWLSRFPEKPAVWIRSLIMFVVMFLIGDLVTIAEP